MLNDLKKQPTAVRALLIAGASALAVAACSGGYGDDAPANGAPVVALAIDPAIAEDALSAAQPAEFALSISDPNGDSVVASISGPDAAFFELVQNGGGAPAILRTVGEFDFELPADANGDNVYEFTINASDGANAVARDFSLEILNVQDTALEQRGALMFLGGEEDELGETLTSLGDIDADGRSEIVLGVPQFGIAAEFSREGAAFLIPGRFLFTTPNAIAELADLGVGDVVQLRGAAADDNAGVAVAPIADVDGDGLNDLVVAADNANGNGEAYLLSAATLLTELDPNAEDGVIELGDVGDGGAVPGVRYFSSGVENSIGEVLAELGDVDGDGADDFLICAPRTNLGEGLSVGRAVVVFSQTTADAAAANGAVDLAGLPAQNTGVFIDGNPAFQNNTCDAAANVGDVDGDGFADILLVSRGASRASRERHAHIIFGSAIAAERLAGGDGVISLTTAVADGAAVQLLPADDFDVQQLVVAGLGDLNNDGFDDVLIGDNIGGGGFGESYVIFGSAAFGQAQSGVIDLSTAAANGLGVTQIADPNVDDMGDDVSAADVNGDGRLDILIAADISGSVGDPSGVVYVVSGTEFDAPKELQLANLGTSVEGVRIIGARSSDQFNSEPIVRSAGDVDGDDLEDILIGAFRAEDDNGEVYLITGRLISDAIASGTEIDLLTVFPELR